MPYRFFCVFLSIQTDSFCFKKSFLIWAQYEQIYSAYSANTHSKILCLKIYSIPHITYRFTCREPAISHDSHHVSLVQCLLPATRVTGSNPLGGTYVKPGFSCQRCLATHPTNSHCSQYTNRFTAHILSIHTDSFCIFCRCAQIISNIRCGIISFTAFKGTLLTKPVCKCSTGPKTHKE